MQKPERFDKYNCSYCGYVYDPEKGFPVDGVVPGTTFDDIPDNWVCPVCGAVKKNYKRKHLLLKKSP